MQTRSSSKFVSESSSNPISTNSKHRNRIRLKPRVKPFSIPIVTMADNQTMEEMLQAPTEGDISNQTNELRNMMASYFQMNTASSLGSGSLPSNTVPNPRADLKAITTRSGVTLAGPSVSPPPSKEVVDPHIPLILGRPFLRTGRALIDVYAYEEYVQEVLGFSDHSKNGNLNPTSDPIIALSSPSLTPFEGGDFILEEIKACLTSKSIPLGTDDTDFDLEGDICLLEELLNKYLSSSPLPPKELNVEEIKIVKSSIDEPSKLEFKELPHVPKVHDGRFHNMIEKTMEVFMDDFSVFEFDVIIRDKKGAENLAADLLSRLENPHSDELEKKEIVETFPLKTLGVLAFRGDSSTPCQVEVSNQGLKRILERTIGENRASWSDKLDDALWAFHTTFKTPIGCTPYMLVYRKDCHLPIDLEHKAYWALKHCNFDLRTVGDHRKVQLNELSELHDQAYENSLIYKEKTKNIHDFKIKDRVFNVGDRVLLFNSCLKIFSGKLKTRWTGPFTVAYVFPYGTIKLS
nr:reverse transcriptase domain-containing protein [Tanacetum cinerariifolium]